MATKIDFKTTDSMGTGPIYMVPVSTVCTVMLGIPTICTYFGIQIRASMPLHHNINDDVKFEV